MSTEDEDGIVRFSSRDHYDLGRNAMDMAFTTQVHNEKMELMTLGIAHMLAAIARKK